jgi:hypothetical protein
MIAEPGRDFFLRAGIEWAAVADAVRAAPHGDDPLRTVALGLWREAAWCHALFAAGRYAAVLDRLRAIRAGVFPTDPAGPVTGPPNATETLAVAADTFHRLRLVIADRCPGVFVAGRSRSRRSA